MPFLVIANVDLELDKIAASPQLVASIVPSRADYPAGSEVGTFDDDGMVGSDVPGGVNGRVLINSKMHGPRWVDHTLVTIGTVPVIHR